MHWPESCGQTKSDDTDDHRHTLANEWSRPFLHFVPSDVFYCGAPRPGAWLVTLTKAARQARGGSCQCRGVQSISLVIRVREARYILHASFVVAVIIIYRTAITELVTACQTHKPAESSLFINTLPKWFRQVSGRRTLPAEVLTDTSAAAVNRSTYNHHGTAPLTSLLCSMMVGSRTRPPVNPLRRASSIWYA